MPGAQTRNGKAFEWAFATALCAHLETAHRVHLNESEPAAISARRAFEQLDEGVRTGMSNAAKKATEHICNELEPRLNPSAVSSPEELSIRLMPDNSGNGESGDVRDVVILSGSGWEIGISAKHNHTAVKHPRISESGIAYSWLGTESTSKWTESMRPVFDWLREHAGEPWQRHKTSKRAKVYEPTLRAVSQELHLLQADQHIGAGETVATALWNFLIGKRDFYKVIYESKRSRVLIQGFNLNGSLNQKQSGRRLGQVPQIRKPRLITTQRIKNNSLILTMDKVWVLSLRVHSADSKIKASGVKFDVVLKSCPTETYQHFIPVSSA